MAASERLLADGVSSVAIESAAFAAGQRSRWHGRARIDLRRWRAGMVLMRIERWDPRRDGPLTESALRQKIEARGYRVSERTYPPGAVAAAQPLDQERLDAVASGLLKVTLDGESAILTAGDMVYVERGTVRRVEVVGSAPVRCFEAVYEGPPS